MCKHLSFLILIAAVLFAALTFIASPSAMAQSQTIVHVDANSTNTSAPSGTNPGNAWGNSAYKYLQDGIQRANQILDGQNPPPAVQIWVRGSSSGLTYYPDEGHSTSLPQVSEPQQYSFHLRSGVQLYGGFNGVGDDELSDRDPVANVTILSGDLNQNDTGSYATNNAGNRSDNAYSVVYSQGVEATARLDGFRVRGGNSVGYGGGLLTQIGSATIVRCTFVDNQAAAGGGVHVDGASFGLPNNPTFINCRIIGNKAIENGGGMCNNSGFVTLVNCVFSGNTCDKGAALISGNASGGPTEPETTLINCSFTGNVGTATVNPPGAVWMSGTTTIKNCILYGDSPSELTASPGATMTVDYSDVQGGWSGSGGNNINAPAAFVDGNGVDNTFGTVDDNLRLTCSSPAINVASSTFLPTDAFDLDFDGNTSETLPHDLDALMRQISTVDMGAYEKQTATGTCAGDADGSCAVDVDDLVAVILAWGACSGCGADTSPAPCGNGQVDVDDLVAVILGWGPCPNGCAATGEAAGADPESYEDCEDMCASLSGDAWTTCMQGCFMRLCQNGHTEFCDD
jgi:hypothetical protein